LKLETLAQTWHARVYFLAINFIILRIRIIFLRCRARAGWKLETGRDKKVFLHNKSFKFHKFFQYQKKGA